MINSQFKTTQNVYCIPFGSYGLNHHFWKTPYEWQLSIAMLNYQRVLHICLVFPLRRLHALFFFLV